MSQRFILQAATPEDHLAPIKRTLSLSPLERALIGVGFLRTTGVKLLYDVLSEVADRTTLVVGIRNGITSAQGLRECLELGCHPYVVDTGTASPVFHPKVYLAKSQTHARVLVGSANLTGPGLRSNIEGGIWLALDLSDPTAAALVSDIEGKFDAMIAAYPDHIFAVTTHEQIDQLLSAGRVADEDLAPPPRATARSSRPSAPSLPRMPLKTTLSRRPFASTPRPLPPNTPSQAHVLATSRTELQLVWTSKPLTRRDLNIPTGPRTNPTGSMLLKKGAFSGIDQLRYFRFEVFGELTWQADNRRGRSHIERARGAFQLVVCGIDQGVFELELSHNTRTTSTTYAQKNSPTSLHWGVARSVVASEHLLGLTAFVFRDTSKPHSFVLEID